MRLGVATTILVGANLILSGSIDFMLLFLFLLVITRVYAPFDQSSVSYTHLELEEVVLNRLISKILVGEVKKIDGQKVQEVRIVYNFVGEIPEITE